MKQMSQTTGRILKWGAVAGAFSAIIVLGTTLGFGVEWPWAPKEKVQLLAQGLEAAIEGQKASNEVQKANTRQGLMNERRYWTDIKRQAMEDLTKDPGNRSAQSEFDRAVLNLSDIDSQLRK